MKPRKWVLYLCAILTILSVVFFVSIRYLEKNSNLESVLEKKISPAVGGLFSFDEIEFGLFSITIKNVTVVLPRNAFTIDVKDVRVGFSLWKLVRNRGDFEKSISKIILLEPRLAVLIDSTLVPTPQDEKKDSSVTEVLSPEAFGVNYLIVKNGEARLIEKNGAFVSIGDHLNGKMWSQYEDLYFELEGKLASHRRNLNLSGVVGSETTRLSFLMEKAKISRPVRLQSLKITRGTFSGLFELVVMSDSAGMPLFDTQGSLHISRGTAQITGVDEAVKDIEVAVTMDSTVWNLDSLKLKWSGLSCKGTGKWDIGKGEGGILNLYAEDIRPERLFPDMPELISKNLFGTGWLGITLRSKADFSKVTARIHGGGINLLERPVTSLQLSLLLEEQKKLTVDSLEITTDLFTVKADATYTFSTEPSYFVNWRCDIDSIPPLPVLEGDFEARGQLWSRTGGIEMNTHINGENLRLFSFPMGNQGILITGTDKKLRIVNQLNRQNDIIFTGFVENPFSLNPLVEISSQLNKRYIKLFIGENSIIDTSVIDVYDINTLFSGSAKAWHTEVSSRIRSENVFGELVLTAERKNPQTLVDWKLYDRGLFLGGKPFPVSMQGKADTNQIIVDSASLLRAVSASGNIFLSQSNTVQAEIMCDRLSLSDFSTWFLKEKITIDGGVVSGVARINGSLKCPSVQSQLHLDNCIIGGYKNLKTDLVISNDCEQLKILPFVIRNQERVVFEFDSVTVSENRFELGVQFEDISVKDIMEPFVEDELPVEALISGSAHSTKEGFPLDLKIESPRLKVDSLVLDSLRLLGSINENQCIIKSFTAKDSQRTSFSLSGRIPWVFLGDQLPENDTLTMAGNITGDILASLEHNLFSPIGGTGKGEIHFSCFADHDGLQITRLFAHIPEGVLTLNPFVASPITDFSFKVALADSNQVETRFAGDIDKRPIVVYSNHSVPQGYESFKIGPLDFGVLQVATPDQGVNLHLPGFQQPGELVDVEFSGKKPFDAFTLSGPPDKLKITGKWILRSGEFTYPFVENDEVPWPFDPYPYVTWEMDIQPGNRKVLYFWDLMRKKRRLFRFFEASLDPTTIVKVRGRMMNKNFRLLGGIRSYKGSVFFGRVFDRRFEVGLDFIPQPMAGGGYDNMPVMWGSAEAFSDTSRFDRITLTLQIQDPVTGAVSERGRVKMIPRSADSRLATSGDSIPNFIFNLSSDLEEIAGSSQRELFQEAGLRITTLEGAGAFVSDFGEKYLHRMLFQRLEKKLAKKLGLDVISFETSFASNYFNNFYNRQFGDNNRQLGLLAFANVGVTVGRYFLNDYLFLKARGELIPIEELLTPEYSFGLEFQPVQYLLMDVNYGIHRENETIVHDPKLNLQLRLPITRFRNFFNF